MRNQTRVPFYKLFPHHGMMLMHHMHTNSNIDSLACPGGGRTDDCGVYNQVGSRVMSNKHGTHVRISLINATTIQEYIDYNIS